MKKNKDLLVFIITLIILFSFSVTTYSYFSTELISRNNLINAATTDDILSIDKERIEYKYIDNEYEFVKSWGENLSGFEPCGSVIYDNCIFVVDKHKDEEGNKGRVLKFDLSGNLIKDWANGGMLYNDFNKPEGITIDNLGNIYVTDTNNHRVQIFDKNGIHLKDIGGEGNVSGKFKYPQGIEIDNYGNIYVADTGNHVIQIFNNNYLHIIDIGVRNSYSFYFPTDIIIDDTNECLYIVDNFNHKLHKYKAVKMLEGLYQEKEIIKESFNLPYSATLDKYGSLVITDKSNHRIVKLDKNGDYLTDWGSYGVVEGQFKYPRGIAVDDKHNVYVSDTLNKRIQQFSLKKRIIQPVKFTNESAVIVDIKITLPHNSKVEILNETNVFKELTFVLEPHEVKIIDFITDDNIYELYFNLKGLNDYINEDRIIIIE